MKTIILTLFLLTIYSLTVAQDSGENRPPLINDLSRTYGFVLGQQFTMDKVKSNHPDLSSKILQLEYEWRSVFGNSMSNIETELKTSMGDKWDVYNKELKSKLSQYFGDNITKEQALEFVDIVKKRCKGDIESPVIETLLIYNTTFKTTPSEEFLRGFKRTFETDGTGKSKGLKFKIEYPQSWHIRDAKRPNLIKFFTSENGRGFVYSSILVNDLKNELKGTFSEKEIDYLLNTKDGNKELSEIFFEQESLVEMANGMGAENISNVTTQKMVLDNCPGAMLDFIGYQERLDSKLKMFCRNYIGLYKGHLFWIQFSVFKNPDESEKIFSLRIEANKPLFRLMANSFIVLNQY